MFRQLPLSIGHSTEDVLEIKSFTLKKKITYICMIDVVKLNQLSGLSITEMRKTKMAISYLTIERTRSCFFSYFFDLFQTKEWTATSAGHLVNAFLIS